MISPEIWTDAKFLKLTVKEKLVFIACISFADDEGILELGSESLWYRINVQPNDLSIAEYNDILGKLSKLGMIVRYDEYAFIPAWFKHQYIKHPTKSLLHRPPESIAKYYLEYLSGWYNQYKEKEYPYDNNGVTRG